MKSSLVILLLFMALLAGCSGPAALQPSAPPRASASQASPLPVASTSDPQATARLYLDAWTAEDYPGMYSLLTTISHDAISPEEFTRHYQGVATEAALTGVRYEIRSVLTNAEVSQVNYRVMLDSLLVGSITRDTVMNLSLEKGQWRVQWDDTLVLPELKGGNYLSMKREGFIPSRGNIYDRNGHALVAPTDATAVGLYPDRIDPAQEESLFTELEALTGLRPETIRSMYANFPSGAGWYLPLGEVSADRVAQRYDVLSALSGLVLSPYKSRYYYNGGIAPHVLGYVSAIQPDELETYRRLGYQPDERVGRDGLEKWGEAYLSGVRGGALYVLNAQGLPQTLLAEAPAQPSQSIVTTLDRDFQIAVQDSIAGFKAAAVVLERNTGRVLAMASSPAFDPNAFEPINYNSDAMLAAINDDPSLPLYNRATQGQYPLGSVFKVITMAAGIESGQYTPETPYQCGYTFTELEGTTLYDWTYEHYQSDRKTLPSGLVTLSQGLMRSCNPFFWHIGLDLYSQGMTKTVSEMARGFGLGSSTGIVGISEAAGQLPDPANLVEAVNMAIGQGPVMVTPLQVADFIAAVGNGGTLYRPQVVEKVSPPDGDPTVVFKPEVRGKLPVKPETLSAIHEALVGVIRSTKPFGTAWHRFRGLDFNVAGKTGTATTGSGLPNAWFAGYTFEERQDKPDIAIAVVVENIGEGSDYAAPIFRRIVEAYFYEKPNTLYWWESSMGVTRSADATTPTPTP